MPTGTRSNPPPSGLEEGLPAEGAEEEMELDYEDSGSPGGGESRGETTESAPPENPRPEPDQAQGNNPAGEGPSSGVVKPIRRFTLKKKETPTPYRNAVAGDPSSALGS